MVCLEKKVKINSYNTIKFEQIINQIQFIHQNINRFCQLFSFGIHIKTMRWQVRTNDSSYNIHIVLIAPKLTLIAILICETKVSPRGNDIANHLLPATLGGHLCHLCQSFASPGSRKRLFPFMQTIGTSQHEDRDIELYMTA